MTREEALHIIDIAFDVPQAIRRAGEDRTYHEDEIREAKSIAIKALEQNPCEDAISRQAVLDAIDAKAWEFCDYLISKSRNDEQKPVSHFADILRECIREDLTPVTPHYTDAEIQKMQELEQAELQKAYELGKVEQPKMGRWTNLEKTKYKGQVLPFWGRYKCSECGNHGQDDFNYCPNCGCRMVEPQESEE